MIKQCIKIGFFAALAIVGMGTLVMVLWNWLIPELFNGNEINFLHALGILLLSKILFGSWKGGWGCGSHCYGGSCHSGKHSYWRNKMEARMANMTPEEKERFKQKYANCGWSEEEKTDK